MTSELLVTVKLILALSAFLALVELHYCHLEGALNRKAIAIMLVTFSFMLTKALLAMAILFPVYFVRQAKRQWRHLVVSVLEMKVEEMRKNVKQPNA